MNRDVVVEEHRGQATPAKTTSESKTTQLENAAAVVGQGISQIAGPEKGSDIYRAVASKTESWGTDVIRYIFGDKTSLGRAATSALSVAWMGVSRALFASLDLTRALMNVCLPLLQGVCLVGAAYTGSYSAALIPLVNIIFTLLRGMSQNRWLNLLQLLGLAYNGETLARATSIILGGLKTFAVGATQGEGVAGIAQAATEAGLQVGGGLGAMSVGLAGQAAKGVAKGVVMGVGKGGYNMARAVGSSLGFATATPAELEGFFGILIDNLSWFAGSAFQIAEGVLGGPFQATIAMFVLVAMFSKLAQTGLSTIATRIVDRRDEVFESVGGFVGMATQSPPDQVVKELMGVVESNPILSVGTNYPGLKHNRVQHSGGLLLGDKGLETLLNGFQQIARKHRSHDPLSLGDFMLEGVKHFGSQHTLSQLRSILRNGRGYIEESSKRAYLLVVAGIQLSHYMYTVKAFMNRGSVSEKDAFELVTIFSNMDRTADLCRKACLQFGWGEVGGNNLSVLYGISILANLSYYGVQVNAHHFQECLQFFSEYLVKTKEVFEAEQSEAPCLRVSAACREIANMLRAPVLDPHSHDKINHNRKQWWMDDRYLLERKEVLTNY
jgi:hypothetical protein